MPRLLVDDVLHRPCDQDALQRTGFIRQGPGMPLWHEVPIAPISVPDGVDGTLRHLVHRRIPRQNLIGPICATVSPPASLTRQRLLSNGLLDNRVRTSVACAHCHLTLAIGAGTIAVRGG